MLRGLQHLCATLFGPSVQSPSLHTLAVYFAGLHCPFCVDTACPVTSWRELGWDHLSLTSWESWDPGSQMSPYLLGDLELSNHTPAHSTSGCRILTSSSSVHPGPRSGTHRCRTCRVPAALPSVGRTGGAGGRACGAGTRAGAVKGTRAHAIAGAGTFSTDTAGPPSATWGASPPAQGLDPWAGPDSDQDFSQLVLLAVRRLLPEAFSGWLGEKTHMRR